MRTKKANLVMVGSVTVVCRPDCDVPEIAAALATQAATETAKSWSFVRRNWTILYTDKSSSVHHVSNGVVGGADEAMANGFVVASVWVRVDGFVAHAPAGAPEEQAFLKSLVGRRDVAFAIAGLGRYRLNADGQIGAGTSGR